MHLTQLLLLFATIGLTAAWFLTRSPFGVPPLGGPSWRRARPWCASLMLIAMAISIATILEPSASLLATAAGAVDLDKIDRALDKLGEDLGKRLTGTETGLTELRNSVKT